MMTLRQLRRQHGLTQKQTARLANLHQGNLSRMERGMVRSPQYNTLLALAIAFKSHPDTVADAVRASIVEAAV